MTKVVQLSVAFLNFKFSKKKEEKSHYFQIVFCLNPRGESTVPLTKLTL